MTRTVHPFLAAVAAALLGLAPHPALAQAVAQESRTALPANTVPLQVSTERSTTLTVWAPAEPRGVVLFSTGFGSWPERYAHLVDALTAEGFAVLAPLHVDSVRYEDRAAFTPQQGFIERFADMRAARDYAARMFEGLPIVAVGHSFGSLVSLGEGGALGGLMPLRVAEVRAALAFSTPGKIPGLIQPDAYSTLEVPVLAVTGTEDLIPSEMGYASTPQDHLLPVQTSPAPAYGLVLQDGDHVLVDNPEMLARAMPAVRLFLRGYGLDDAAARAALAAWQPAQGDQFITPESAE